MLLPMLLVTAPYVYIPIISSRVHANTTLFLYALSPKHLLSVLCLQGVWFPLLAEDVKYLVLR